MEIAVLRSECTCLKSSKSSMDAHWNEKHLLVSIFYYLLGLAFDETPHSACSAWMQINFSMFASIYLSFTLHLIYILMQSFDQDSPSHVPYFLQILCMTSKFWLNIEKWKFAVNLIKLTKSNARCKCCHLQFQAWFLECSPYYFLITSNARKGTKISNS